MSMKKQMLVLIGGVVLIAGVAVATPPSGFLVNQILATGATDPDQPLSENFIVRNAAGDRWHLKLSASGPSNFYVQEVVLAAGGYSGWHHHPGVLLITVTEGVIDWYDGDCSKTTYTAGQSFTESNAVHDLVNPGVVNAHLFIAYITMKDEPRRIDNNQPTCGINLGLL